MANNIMSENSLRTCIIAACAIGYAIISFFIPELNILIAIAHLLFTLIGMVGVEIIWGKSTTGIIIVLLLSFCTNFIFGWIIATILYKLFKSKYKIIWTLKQN